MKDENSSGIYLSYRIRVRTEELDINWLTKQMTVEPSWAFQAGEEYLSRRPDGSGGWRKVKSVRPFTVWGINTKGVVESTELKHHFEYLISTLEPSKPVIEDLVSKPDLYDIGLLLRINSIDDIFSDSISSYSLTRLTNLFHRFDLSFIYTGTL